MNQTRYDLIMTSRAIRRVIGKGTALVGELADIEKEIQTDPDHNDNWKAGKLEHCRKVRNENLQRLGAKVETLLDSYMELVESARQSFDYRDETFQIAVRTLSAFGRNTPPALAQQIAQSFAGNLGALKNLKQLYKGYDLGTDALDDLIKPLDGLGLDDHENIIDLVSHAKSELVQNNEWHSRGVLGMLDKYEKGLAYDASVNPVKAEVAALRDDPHTSDTVRNRIDGWMRVYSDALDNDDENAMSLTLNRLESWRDAASKAPGVWSQGQTEIGAGGADSGT